MTNKRIDTLNHLINKIELLIPKMDIENPSVSKANIGWQLDHALKVFNTVSQIIETSNPENYSYQFSFWRSTLFTIGYFPRGKVKAPKAVQPPSKILEADLESQIKTARTHIEKLKLLPEKSYYHHFIFGKLAKNNTLRFLAMHTNHHLKIIRDILKA